jgi:LDH2 family malate/lactate/ureidoglycolate dehydrogenase
MAEQVRVAWQPLQAFVEEVFVHAGLDRECAAIEAEVLIWAQLRGVDSHGVHRIKAYVEAIDAGYINCSPDIRIEMETPATVLIEADHAFGPAVTVFAMERVMEKARGAGIGWGLIRNTTHQGAIGYYALMAAKQDMAGLIWVCTHPNMAPFGAKARGVHNSPIAIAVPGNHRPLLLDMATSVVAAGWIGVAIDKDEPIPVGWAQDKQGRPTTDPRKVGMVLPAGGYKGSGLALMFECLSSVMAGCPALLPHLLDWEEKPAPWTMHSVVAAVDIGTFTDIDRYKAHIDATAEAINALPTAEGTERVYVPGEREDLARTRRLVEGIPLPEGTVAKLREMSQRFEIALPEGVS